MASAKTTLLIAASLLGSLFVFTSTAAAHVCAGAASPNCAGDDCPNTGLLHIHIGNNGTCESVCGEICNGEAAARSESVEPPAKVTWWGSIFASLRARF